MEVAKEYPQVRMEHRKNGTGLATAVLDGFKLAKGEYMACMDADLQHPPIVLKYMYKAMESGADFCIPSRLIPGGDDEQMHHLYRFCPVAGYSLGNSRPDESGPGDVLRTGRLCTCTVVRDPRRRAARLSRRPP